MEIRIGIAKTHKYAVSASGDSVEITERPRGGISAILADGQGSGKPAKSISALVVNKAAGMIADGARDGAVARAVHDYLYVMKDGRVSATLTIISVDMDTSTCVFSRNSNCPIIVKQSFGVDFYDEPVNPIGVQKNMKPLLTQLPLEEGIIAVTFSDGILHAGKKQGRSFDTKLLLQLLDENGPDDVQYIADALLDYSLALDDYRAGDDMTVLVLGVSGRQEEHKIERMSVIMPV